MIARALAAAYVATEAGLTAAAFSGPDGVTWAKVAAGVLALPSVIVALPAVYLLGALAWSFADSPASGSASSADPALAAAPIWPVTLTFTVVMTLVACANVALVSRTVRALAGRSRRGASPAPTADWSGTP